jgi:hypothetical protein
MDLAALADDLHYISEPRTAWGRLDCPSRCTYQLVVANARADGMMKKDTPSFPGSHKAAHRLTINGVI